MYSPHYTEGAGALIVKRFLSWKNFPEYYTPTEDITFFCIIWWSKYLDIKINKLDFIIKKVLLIPGPC